MALWNDLIPRLHRPRQLVDRRPAVSTPATVPQRPSTPASPPPTALQSTLAAMKRDGRGSFATAMSAVGQDRKSLDFQRDADVLVDGGETGSSNGDEEDGGTVSFSLAVTVGSVLLLLNVIVFVATMCQLSLIHI